jgi:hypothetical protein
VYDQLPIPVAGCQVAPPSTDTSTPATTPAASVAVPDTVTWVPNAMVPLTGWAMLTTGAVWSPDADAATNPACRLVGWTPISASRLMVPCWIAGIAPCVLRSWVPSSPQPYWMVPALKTNAPDAARYSLKWWVSVPGAVWLPKSWRISGTAATVVDAVICPAGAKPLSTTESAS